MQKHEPTPTRSSMKSVTMQGVGCELKKARVLCGLTVLWICCISAVFSVDVESGPGAISLVPVTGTLGPLNTTACWQLPNGPVKKVFFIFEPMGNVPSDFWDRSPSCSHCKGLPEKRKLIIDALARNYAVFIPRSLDEPGIWISWPLDNFDLNNAKTMYDEWKIMHGLENVPTIGLGISSGGFAVSTMALHPGMFESIAVVICKGTFDAYELATHEYPPTIFVHMPKDTYTAENIAKARVILGSKGVLTTEATWYEHAVTPDWFTQITPVVDLALSSAVHDNLKADGWLDENNFLNSDGFRDVWDVDVLRWNVLPPNPEGQILADCLFEEMNVAFARHWTIARNDAETFAWLDGGYNSQRSEVATF